MREALKPLLILSALLVGACSDSPKVQLSPDEKAMVVGSRVRTNTTINTETFRCLDGILAKSGAPKIGVAIGNIADYTGKTMESEGAVITRGGSLMLFSALGLMPNSVRLHDRFDTSVTDLELAYLNARQLGDGRTHEVDGQIVPWMPYYGGSIRKSDYTILGGITEVNLNIDSGGYSAQVNQIGPRARSFTMSVAADLRLVQTETLVVVATSSFQKQFTGYETGANLFSFFDVFNDKQLFDVYAGNIAQEPLQLGVRAILEEATLELLASLTKTDYTACAYPKLVFVEVPREAGPAAAAIQTRP
jgi:curli biogenesis system outer membrane secretion channel CsgG